MFRGLNGQEADYTRGELKKALEAGQVLEAVIQPNKETPTGIVRVALSTGEEKILYVTDVKEVEGNSPLPAWTRKSGIFPGKTGL